MPAPDNNGYHLTIREMSADERPRERLQHYGPGALSNAELLAILLSTGTKGENVLNLSSRLLAEHGGLAGLSKAGFGELARIKGLGQAKTCQLKAALELGRRLMLASPGQRLQITSPADAANMLMAEMSLLEQEHLRVLLLDTKNYIISAPTIYIGNVNTSIVRTCELFREAIRENSTSIIMAHNHPSGDPTPSPEDVQITKQVVEAGNLLNIKVLDHLIIGKQRYTSLKERGLF